MKKAASSPNRLGASIADLTFIVWALVVPTLLRTRLFTSDGDFARHLRMGHLILEKGPWFIDDLAWTHSGPFVTTEWLSQLAFALADRAAGLAGVAVLAGCVLGLAYAFIVVFMRRAGVDPLLTYTTAMIAAVLGAPHWVARPHLFTFLGLAVLLNVALSEKKRRLWVYAPLFLLWANFHGGFILGIATLGALAAGSWVEARLAPAGSDERSAWQGRARHHALAAGVGIMASLANPMGPGLFARVAGILGNKFLMATAAEFQSLNFHTTYGRLFLVVLLGVIALLAVQRKRPSFSRLAVVVLLLAGALTAGRNAPLFALVVLPLLAVETDGMWRRLGGRRIGHLRTVFAEGEAVARPGRWAPGVAAAMAVLALTGGSIAGVQIITDDFDADEVPVDAIARARAAGLDGRMYNQLRWGGYILLRWPEQRIFTDGMTDFLGNDVLGSYIRLFMLDPEWDRELEDRGITMVIMPPRSRLVHALRERPDWNVWYEDDVAVILLRRGRLASLRPLPATDAATDARQAREPIDRASGYRLARTTTAGDP